MAQSASKGPAKHSRRRVTTMACDTCRARKIRCDTSRPLCGNCRLYNTECSYDQPRQRRGPKPLGMTQRPAAALDEPSTGSAQPCRNEDANALTVLVQSQGPVSPRNESVGQLPVCSQSPATPRVDSVRRHDVLSPPTQLGSPSPDTRQAGHHNLPWLYPPIPYGSPSTHASVAASTTIQHALVMSLTEQASDPRTLVEKCLERFIACRFPLLPAIQFTSLLGSVSLLCQLHGSVPDTRLADHEPHREPAFGGMQLSLEEMRSFTLLTAVCAVAATLRYSPPITTTGDVAFARTLVSASRQMLSCYADHDMDNPDSSSLIIRFLHSNTLHSLGKTRIAMHLLRTSYSLAISLRLYDEESLSEVPPLEAQKRRVAFWALYQADKSASLLNNEPTMIMELCLGRPITLEKFGPFEPNLLGKDHPLVGASFEAQIMTGFHLSTQLWAAIADVFLEMNTLVHMRARAHPGSSSVNKDPVMSIMHSYMTFHRLLDNLPSYLRDPDSHIADNAAATALQQKAFWTQRSNILVTFHCIQLAILRQAQTYRLSSLLGLTDDGSMLALRKMNIAGDLLAAAKSVRFEGLQANGEPCVEKFRQAGVELLGILHETKDPIISSRATSLFSDLLDLIAALNSQVSEELASHLVV